MCQLHHYVYRSGLVLVLGRLAGCGTASLPSANVPPAIRSTALPTTMAVSETTLALPYPVPYPGPSPAPQQQPTDQHVQSPTSSADSFPAPALGVVVDPDMRVLSVDVASAAEAAGVQPGDQLETLDRIPVGSQTQKVKQYIRMAGEDQAMQLVVRRGTSTIEVIVVPFSSHARSRPTVEPGLLIPTVTPVVPPDDYL